MVPTLLGVALISFAILRVVPGDIVSSAMPRAPLSPASRSKPNACGWASTSRSLQFVGWLWGAVAGLSD